jgi:BirA family biotin operon repressor/biotin-[acetyl-CoA-carboxylase] ligase
MIEDDLEVELGTGGSLASLRTRVVGHTLRHVPGTGSTNDDLKAAARAGAAEGLVLSTDEQTAGRGRHDRRWEAPARTSLLISVLLRPTWLVAADGFYLTMLAAVACAEAIEQVIATTVDLKWPNDLQIDGLKIGGILVEAELLGGTIRWAVVGIGLNANWDPTTIPYLATTATSLSTIAGRPISRARLLQALLERIDVHYTRLEAGARAPLAAAWRQRLVTLGRWVQAERAGRSITGIAEEVTPTGALIIRDDTGMRHELTSGEVTLQAR